MRPTTIRFSDQLASLIAAAARQEGVSFAQYVREATLIRYTLQRAWTASAAKSSGGVPDVLTTSDLAKQVAFILAALDAPTMG